MRFCQTYGLRTVLALSGLALISTAPQAKPQSKVRSVEYVYVTSRACQTNGILSIQECRNAFANAEAEFNDNVPVFDNQGDCEKQFPRCVISFSDVSDPKTLRFSPMMKGVRVTVNSDDDRTVAPVLEGQHPVIQFSSRTVLRLQDYRSSLKQQDTRNRWIAFQRSLEFQDAFKSDPHQDTEFRSTSLAPKLIEWCEQFCASVQDHRALASAEVQTDASLFKPSIDTGAQLQEITGTHQFSRQSSLATRTQPRFVLKMGTRDTTAYQKTSAASLPLETGS